MRSLEGGADRDSTPVGFDDDDITIDRPIPVPPPKLYQAVIRELGRLWGTYERLKQARETQHFAKIDTLAEDCVHQWLLAQAVRRRFEQTYGEMSYYVQSASVAVDGAAQLLAPHLRPMAQLSSSARRRLARLRLTIQLAKSDRAPGRKASVTR